MCKISYVILFNYKHSMLSRILEKFKILLNIQAVCSDVWILLSNGTLSLD